MALFRKQVEMVSPEQALPGRSERMPVPERHEVLGTQMTPPFPEGTDTIVVGMGCFWGAEKFFWQAHGVYTTAVGYAGGFTPNPTYEEVCSGRTGHAEVALVVFDPTATDLDALFKVFWENHDPTTANRQGNDVGTQYRSCIYWTSNEQRDAAIASKRAYQAALTQGGYGEISTEVAKADEFYYAEPYHQQYLHKVPHGYCNHGFCQVAYAGR